MGIEQLRNSGSLNITLTGFEIMNEDEIKGWLEAILKDEYYDVVDDITVEERESVTLYSGPEDGKPVTR